MVLHHRRSSKRLSRTQQWSGFKFGQASLAEPEQCCMFYGRTPERRGGAAAATAAIGALTLLAWVHVRGQLHVIGREEPHLPADFSSPPVGVLLVEDVDDLALAEGQLVIVLCGVIVHPDHLAHCRRQGWVSSWAARCPMCSRWVDTCLDGLRPSEGGGAGGGGASLDMLCQQRKMKDCILRGQQDSDPALNVTTSSPFMVLVSR